MMKIELKSEIGQVNVTTSFFHENGYKNVDLHLLDEVMLILSTEEDKMTQYDGPGHCDPYITLAYDNLVEANELAAADSERMTARVTELYENCAARKALLEAYSIPYNELDQRGCDIENDPESAKPGEYKYISDEMERLQDLMDARAPYEYDDKRDLSDVLAAINP
jgi:hypothetical protein